MMLCINVKLTLIAIIIVPGYFAISKVISKKITKNTVLVQENTAHLNADMFETLNGMEEVKLLNGKQTQLSKIFFKTNGCFYIGGTTISIIQKNNYTEITIVPTSGRVLIKEGIYK